MLLWPGSYNGLKSWRDWVLPRLLSSKRVYLEEFFRSKEFVSLYSSLKLITKWLYPRNRKVNFELFIIFPLWAFLIRAGCICMEQQYIVPPSKTFTLAFYYQYLVNLVFISIFNPTHCEGQQTNASQLQLEKRLLQVYFSTSLILNSSSQCAIPAGTRHSSPVRLSCVFLACARHQTSAGGPSYCDVVSLGTHYPYISNRQFWEFISFDRRLSRPYMTGRRPTSQKRPRFDDASPRCCLGKLISMVIWRQPGYTHVTQPRLGQCYYSSSWSWPHNMTDAWVQVQTSCHCVAWSLLQLIDSHMHNHRAQEKKSESHGQPQCQRSTLKEDWKTSQLLPPLPMMRVVLVVGQPWTTLNWPWYCSLICFE